MENEYCIQVCNVTKKYALYSTPSDRLKEVFSIREKCYHRDFYALRDVTFDVRKGETVGIIGTNGSGKSTILKIITGVLSPTDGSVEVQGKVSALLELGAGFNMDYTGRENIFLNGRTMGISKKEMQDKEQAIIDFAEIGDFIDQPVKSYSSGMFARLAFAVAINVEPDILIVDEALSVGDLFFQNKCFHKFDELKARGVTILFVSHDISSVRQMCSRALWLDHGVARAFDDADTICDMYMDEKRKGVEFVSAHLEDVGAREIKVESVREHRCYPGISCQESRFLSDKVQIRSAFFVDSGGKTCTTLHVDQEYGMHIVIECMQEVHSIIVGFVMENNKGLPLYDINNYINQGETLNGKAGQTYEFVFQYRLPRIMNGMYVLAVAVADGTQARHEMLTWLHGVMQVEVVNEGYNSSYIEIPSRISVYANDSSNVRYIAE